VRPDIPALLAGIGQGGLHVSQRDGLTVVQGVVATGADADAVRDLLRRAAPDHAVAHLAVVNDVLASIGESLHEPTLKAGYAGNGRFIVSGTTRDGATVQRRLAQLAADLGPAVTRLDADVTEVRPGWSMADSDSALDAGGLRYVQSLDGSKHFPGASMAAHD
jgi:type III secretion protein D